MSGQCLVQVHGKDVVHEADGAGAEKEEPFVSNFCRIEPYRCLFPADNFIAALLQASIDKVFKDRVVFRFLKHGTDDNCS